MYYVDHNNRTTPVHRSTTERANHQSDSAIPEQPCGRSDECIGRSAARHRDALIVIDGGCDGIIGHGQSTGVRRIGRYARRRSNGRRLAARRSSALRRPAAIGASRLAARPAGLPIPGAIWGALRTELQTLQLQSGHCRLEVSRNGIFEESYRLIMKMRAKDFVLVYIEPSVLYYFAINVLYLKVYV